MRIVVTPLAAACLVLPAAAFAAEPDGDTRRMAETLHDPVVQAQVAASAEAVTDAVLGMPAAPLMKAMAEIAGEDPDYVDPDLRVGDLVDPDTADKSREFAHRLPQMMGALAGLAAAMEDMLPELRERIETARDEAYRY